MKALIIRLPIDGFAWKKEEMDAISLAIARSDRFPPDYNQVAAVVGTRTAMECKSFVLRAIEKDLITVPAGLGTDFKAEELEGEPKAVQGIGSLALLPPWAVGKRVQEAIKYLWCALLLKGLEKGVKEFVANGLKSNLNQEWMEKMEVPFIALLIWLKIRKN